MKSEKVTTDPINKKDTLSKNGGDGFQSGSAGGGGAM
jgi:hypothetical protein